MLQQETQRSREGDSIAELGSLSSARGTRGGTEETQAHGAEREANQKRSLSALAIERAAREWEIAAGSSIGNVCRLKCLRLTR